MIKFLHLADIHLGTNQYNSPDNTRKKDFFSSFLDVVERYAIKEKVDFVLISGDLLDKNRIDPNTLNQSIIVFNLLKQNKIPVFVIEGNHDSQWSRDSVSWLQFLGEHEYICYLKSDVIDDKLTFTPSYREYGVCGCCYLNKNVRIIGTQWYGANTYNIIPQINEAIEILEPRPFTIFLLHGGIEGYLSGYGSIPLSSLLTLKEQVNYLALGHVHKYYSVDNWIYNPGSLEACCVPEYFDPHGAILVKIDKNNQFKATLLQKYQKREFIRIYSDISSYTNSEEAFDGIKDNIVKIKKQTEHFPIVELYIDGVQNFNFNELDMNSIKSFIKTEHDAMVVLVKNYSKKKEYSIGANLSLKNTRDQIEFTVIKDSLSQYDQYKQENETYSQAIINLKNMVLNLEPNDKIYDYLKTTIDKAQIK